MPSRQLHFINESPHLKGHDQKGVAMSAAATRLARWRWHF
ncbi:hypothetical protein EcE24377A_0855 [Escherichia coli O139:H28 str. E24377A]|uniref:Uncharacterized protein n=1 Tax=Escherichia coli O139:H28 (strain E24377A / ETEC) TaxID=331111 RepID=A7ZJK0_ECO24|nr:hypothetical protein EcE24377A_0855 [Escherichia coli O139:H28 str. E24377A]